jgi:hypothetical protein
VPLVISARTSTPRVNGSPLCPAARSHARARLRAEHGERG